MSTIYYTYVETTRVADMRARLVARVGIFQRRLTRMTCRRGKLFRGIKAAERSNMRATA